jgi:hypothetical protein
MTMTVKGRYEAGSVRLEEPLPLDDGTQVEVEVTVAEPKAVRRKTPYEIVQEIAALYVPHPDEAPFSGEDHDKVLYGENGAA